MVETTRAGPSRQQTPSVAQSESKQSGDNRLGVQNASSSSQRPDPQQQDVDEDEDEDRMELSTLQGFAEKVQRYPQGHGSDETTGRKKIVIPKRGEKDFEPIQEAANLQEMMLQRSREALFGALMGVRGGNSKAMSHALLTPTSPYPRMLITRGHIFDSLGIPVRYGPDSTGPARTYTELLPEEALYLLERGTLQIWSGPVASTPEEVAAGVGLWCEEEFGVRGAVELSVMEGFATFVGQDGLSLERYQAYSYLKRLGYTVQRPRRFLPRHFLSPLRPSEAVLPPFKTWWSNIPGWITRWLSALCPFIQTVAGKIFATGLDLSRNILFRSSLLHGACDYPGILSRLRLVSSSHSLPVPSHTAPDASDIFQPLVLNPYLPFWHIWKPASPWSKANWDRGSEEGLQKQKPEYIAAVISARDVQLPSKSQLAEVFEQLPPEPQGPVKKLGPQYQRHPPKPRQRDAAPGTCWDRLFPNRSTPQATFNNQSMGALRNGDRALIVAVNDSGNTGWIRFGRTGFADHPVL